MVACFQLGPFICYKQAERIAAKSGTSEMVGNSELHPRHAGSNKGVRVEVHIAERVLESLAVRHFLLPFEEQVTFSIMSDASFLLYLQAGLAGVAPKCGSHRNPGRRFRMWTAAHHGTSTHSAGPQPAIWPISATCWTEFLADSGRDHTCSMSECLCVCEWKLESSELEAKWLELHRTAE